MNKRQLVLVTLLLPASAMAMGQTTANTPSPAALRAWEAHARQYCRDMRERYVGARFAPMPTSGIDGRALPAGAGRYLAAEFNGDGKQDFIIVTPNGGCAGLNEGRDGPELTVEFVVSTANGYSRDASVQPGGSESTLVLPAFDPAWRQRRGNADVLRFETGSAGAGRCGPLPAEVAWGWNGRHVDVLERYNARHQLIDEEGCRVGTARAPARSGQATGAITSGRAAAVPGRIPLEVGYYAYVEGTFSTCAKPVGDPWYFDGKRFWEKSDFSDPRHEYSPEALRWEMVSDDRFRISYRSRDEDGNWERSPSVNEFVINGPGGFTFVGVVGQRMGSNEKHQRCPNLPANLRFFRTTK